MMTTADDYTDDPGDDVEVDGPFDDSLKFDDDSDADVDAEAAAVDANDDGAVVNEDEHPPVSTETKDAVVDALFDLPQAKDLQTLNADHDKAVDDPRSDLPNLRRDEVPAEIAESLTPVAEADPEPEEPAKWPWWVALDDGTVVRADRNGQPFE